MRDSGSWRGSSVMIAALRHILARPIDNLCRRGLGAHPDIRERQVARDAILNRVSPDLTTVGRRAISSCCTSLGRVNRADRMWPTAYGNQIVRISDRAHFTRRPNFRQTVIDTVGPYML
jgi:hypothetical protein